MGNSAAKFTSAPGVARLGSTRKSVLVQKLVDVVHDTLLPLATDAVAHGDRFYATAILRKSDLSVVITSQDATTSKDPTATAELNVIQSFFSIEATTRPTAADCIVLCLHEPASVALYQFAQSGFDNFVFLFGRDESKAMGADETKVTLKEIFVGAGDNEDYHKENDYWTAISLREMIEHCEKKEKTVEEVKERLKEVMGKAPSTSGPPTPVKTSADA